MKVYTKSKSKFVAFAAITTVLVFASAAAAMTLTVQPAKAFPGGPCAECAKDFAPGQEAKIVGPTAKDFAPGQEAKIVGPTTAKDFAPGQVKKQPTT